VLSLYMYPLLWWLMPRPLKLIYLTNPGFRKRFSEIYLYSDWWLFNAIVCYCCRLIGWGQIRRGVTVTPLASRGWRATSVEKLFRDALIIFYIRQPFSCTFRYDNSKMLGMVCTVFLEGTWFLSESFWIIELFCLKIITSQLIYLGPELQKIF